MTLPPQKSIRRKHRLIGLSAALAVPGCIFIILLIITNTHWIPVYIPTLPWVADPLWFAFETPFVAAVSLAFLLGSMITHLLWHTVYRQSRQHRTALQQQVSILEATIEKTQRLISSTRGDEISPQPRNQQE